MKRVIAKRWVAALRSGKYKQGRGQLRRGDKFCCLGVLCDISKLSEWSEPRGNGYTYLEHDGILPLEVKKWSGIGTESGEIHFGSFSSLTELNDDGRRFSTIAKVIEEHWKEL